MAYQWSQHEIIIADWSKAYCNSNLPPLSSKPDENREILWCGEKVTTVIYANYYFGIALFTD